MNAPVRSLGVALSADQMAQLRALAAGFTRDQAIWVSGYFAGLSADPIGLEAAAPAVAAAPTVGTRTLTILYASETGNAGELARACEARAREVGLTPTVGDLAAYKPRRLKDEQDLILISSTHGDGDPPAPANAFFEALLTGKPQDLSGLRYAVLGLGDSTYEFFCEAAKKLDTRLEELGAERLHPRVDCDVDYDEPAAAWLGDVLGKLAAKTSQGAAAVAAIVSAPGQPQVQAYGKRNPFPAEVLENLVLTGRGSSKETRHVEFSLAGSGLAYEPGDALGVVPRNDPRLVEAVLTATGLGADATVAHKGETLRLADALEREFEITALTPRFVSHWGDLAEAAELRRLGTGADRTALAAFMHDHHILDVVRTHPVKGLSPETFVAGLRTLQPRLYSIASSLHAAPEEAHLTVSSVRYDLHGEARGGVASTFLAERVRQGDPVPVYIQSNPHFRLPADGETPIIMIGAGTGIAPYRAFLQQREALGTVGRSWLFFGERKFRTDFLYQIEWQAYLKSGVLSRMDVAFSRDQAGKVYVQQRMRERARELFGWLEDGAHVYVCGDANALAPDVHKALVDLIASEGALGPDQAEDYMRALERDNRYQRDVY